MNILSYNRFAVIVLVFLMPFDFWAQENRSIDGTLNHPVFLWGVTNAQTVHKGPLAYEDGISSPAGPNRPNPRLISNMLFSQTGAANDPLGLSAYTWAWGQFIDHDITLSPDNEDENLDIPVPAGDPFFDPNGTGQVVIPMHRSDFDPSTGHNRNNPRKFYNGITAFIDGSAIYGSDQQRASWLRTFEQGKLKTSEGNLLPFNTITGNIDDEIDPLSPEMAMPMPHVRKWFVAGDIRANENPLLTGLHTIFVREHNRLCSMLAVENPGWSDEQLYQRARKLVGGMIQAIVYEEWLPTLGVDLPSYDGYDMVINPGIMNEFSAGAYRYGHSTISAEFPRMDNAGNIMAEGNMQLKDAFFNPGAIMEVGGIEPFLIGASTVVEQNVDCKVIDDLRNFLFGPPGAGGLDLVALNINRGRDRGIADYNTIRSAFGLPKLVDFVGITADPIMQRNLKEVYGNVDDIDLWVGVLAEDQVTGSLFGPTLRQVMHEQFSNLRAGDRYYYENDGHLSSEVKNQIKNTSLSQIIRRNSGISFLPENIFHVMETPTVVDRTLDGTMNNQFNSNWGAAGTLVKVASSIGYADGISAPAGTDRPNPRLISNEVFAQSRSVEDPLNLTAYVWGWGQFIDHDITLSPDHPTETMDISVPRFDAFFDPQGSGDAVIPMHRSDYDRSTGTDVTNPRIHINAISAYIDASAVYGSDLERAAWLREFSGGRMKTSAGNLLPYNTLTGEFDDARDPLAPEMAMPFPHVNKYFVAGDIRANENPFLTSFHTLFVREHNRLCDELITAHPGWTDEMLYQRARKIVGALIQSVVYEEWLPTLGMEVTPYQGYDQTINPGIMTEFSSAAYRYGHSTIGSTLVRMDNNGDVIPQGNIDLKDAFFNPFAIAEVEGIEPYLMGMSSVVQQNFDGYVVNDLRNFLFGPPGAGGLDLVALNINRGRDRGLPDYNTLRQSFQLNPVTSFAKLSDDPVVNQTLATVYNDISDIDPWVGILLEEHMDNALFGPTAMTIIKKQFMDLRDGDRYYYEIDPEFTRAEALKIKATRLSDIIRRNSTSSSIPDQVFIIESVTTAVRELDEPVELRIYPNPASDYIRIEFGSTNRHFEPNMLQIIDVVGKILYAQTIDENKMGQPVTINLDPSMPPGFYALRASDGINLITQPFVKVGL